MTAAPSPSVVSPPIGRWQPSRLVLGLIVLAALATRLPFLMHEFDEVDSSNFARGLVHFSIPHHQPHPPGQFYYIMLLQGLNRLVGDELTTLSLGSVLGSCLALIPLFYALRAVFRDEVLALSATGLTAFCYGFWLTGLRPISDPVGCFFVYGTIAALFVALERPRWYLVAMGVFAVTLGVKQLTLYFLAPLVLLASLIVLLTHGWRVALAGAGVFAVLLLGWLLPSVHNAGGWTLYRAMSSQQQYEVYRDESLITHFSEATVRLHAWHDFIAPWGSPWLAGVMLVLAVLGLVPLWLTGRQAKLFVIFGLGSIIYIFLIQSIFGKYYMYTLPMYCVFAVAGLRWLGGGLAAVTRATSPVWAAPVGAGVLAVASACLTVPLLEPMHRFRSPPQLAYEELCRRHGGSVAGLDIITNSGLSYTCLLYYNLKQPFTLVNSVTGTPMLPSVLGSDKPRYVFSAAPSGGAPDRFAPLGRYEWPKPLRDILQCWPEYVTLYLYEIKGGLPADYALHDGILRPLIFNKGFSLDGWAGPDCEFILPRDDTPAGFVEIQGGVPAGVGFQFPLHIAYETPVNGGKRGEFTIAAPGSFDVVLPVEKSPSGNCTDLHLLSPQSYVPARTQPSSPDDRMLSLHIEALHCTSSDHPMLMSYLDGSWYLPETQDAHHWRWCQGSEGKIQIAVERGGTLTIDGQLLCLHGGERVDVLLDGVVVTTVDLPDGRTPLPQTLRVPVTAGQHTLGFRGQHPGESPPGDGRVLSIGTYDLRISLE